MNNKSYGTKIKTKIDIDSCPVCGKNMPDNGIICNICGYDMSLDYQLFPTLECVKSNANTVSKLKEEYEKNVEKEKEYDNAKKRIIELEEENTKLKNDCIKAVNFISKNQQKELIEAKKRIDELEKENSDLLSKNELISHDFEEKKQLQLKETDKYQDYIELNREYNALSQKYEVLEKENKELKRKKDFLWRENIELYDEMHPYTAINTDIGFGRVLILVIEWICFIIAIVSALNSPAIHLVNISGFKWIFLIAMGVFCIIEYFSYDGLFSGVMEIHEKIYVISFFGFLFFWIYSVICLIVSLFKYGIKDPTYIYISISDYPIFECFFICVGILGIFGILKENDYSIAYRVLFETFVLITLIIICVKYVYLPHASKNVIKEIDNKTIEYTSGDIYNGEVVDGKRQGHGVMYYANGDIYEGNWILDKKSGYGEKSCEKWVYIGNWAIDKSNGYGICSYSGGEKYIGEWKNDNKHGYGIMTYPNGDKYEGEYKDDKKNGHGVYTFADGEIYDGEWVNGYMEGNGKRTYSDGNIYTGEFVAGEMQGQGIYIFTTGHKYIGEFMNGYFNGYGIYKWPEGKVYEGEWENNNMNGQGKMTYADGKVENGEWKDGVFIGK